MRLSVLSDLHLSRGALPHPTVPADVVVLAGDVARPAQAIEWARGLGKPTLFVPGNHEFYGGSLPGTLRELKELAAGSQVRVLDDEEWTCGNVRFLGCTLWTDFLLMGAEEGREVAIREALQRMYDFHATRTRISTSTSSSISIDRAVHARADRRSTRPGRRGPLSACPPSPPSPSTPFRRARARPRC